MKYVISPEAIRSAIIEINKWHPNTPLLLVFSQQKPGSKGEVSGGAQAVRNVYDNLFNLENKGGVSNHDHLKGEFQL